MFRGDELTREDNRFDYGELVQCGRGRPKLANGKTLVSIRLDQDVLAGLRSLGAGWQTKANAALKEWLKLASRPE